MRSEDVRREALRRLPDAHSRALRLRDAGLTDALIAECLGIDRVAVRPLLVVAEAKLRSELDESA